jgi:hypothetical protein
MNTSGAARHAMGAIATFWGVAAWAEWFVVPMLYPGRSGPAPYLDFALGTVVLFLGCFINATAVLLWPWRLAWYWRVAYALVPASYVGFQFARM